MKLNIHSHSVAPILLSLLLAANAPLAIADEAAGTAPKNFPGESPMIIPAAAFASDGNAPTEYVYNTNGFIGGVSSTACLQAPVYLPDGATVTQLTASMVDMADTDMTVSLMRTNNTGYRSTVSMASLTTNGNSYPLALTNWYGTTTIGNAVVSYPAYSYFVQVCLADWHFQLYQVEIEYDESVIFRDGFESGNSAAWSAAAAKGALIDIETAEDSATSDAYVPGNEKSVPYASPLTIAPSEFKPNGSEAGEVFISFIDGVMYGGNYAGARYMHAPVYLPNGATITAVAARVVDNDAGGGGVSNCASGATSDIGLSFYRSKGCAGSTCYDELGSAETTGASAMFQFLTLPTIAYPVVDGNDYGYHVMIRLCGPKHEVRALRVSYTMP